MINTIQILEVIIGINEKYAVGTNKCRSYPVVTRVSWRENESLCIDLYGGDSPTPELFATVRLDQSRVTKS